MKKLPKRRQTFFYVHIYIIIYIIFEKKINIQTYMYLQENLHSVKNETNNRRVLHPQKNS